MAAELTVGIGADNTDLNRTLDQSTRSIQQFSRTAVQETRRTGVAFQGMSRVMSDAAFGPGAIANNLQGLGDDFRQLSSAARESGQSIGRTLLQSLAGPGGLNLALGGLTLGLSLASFGLGAWERAFGTADKKVKDTTDSVKDYVESLEAARGAQLKGKQNAQAELSDLKLLFDAYTNANLPLKRRQDAYAELQEKYPAYFKNLKFEKEAGEKTTSAYKTLTASILATAQARAISDKIASKASEQLTNEEKIVDLEAERLGLINQSLAVGAQIKKIEESASLHQRSTESFAKRVQRLTEQQLDLEELQGKKTEEITEIKRKNLKLDEDKNRLAESFNQVAIDNLTTETKVTEQKKKQVDLLAKAIKFKPTLDDPLGDPLLKAPVEKLKLGATFGLDFSAAFAEVDQFYSQLQEQNEMLRQSFQSAFEGIGQAIGNAFANGENPLKAAGAAILGAIGDVLVTFGKMTIKAGIAATALYTALSQPLNPGSGPLAIAAGIALVAIGSAVKGFAGGLGKSGSSGGGGMSSPSAPGSGFEPRAVAYAGGQSSNVFIPSMTIKGQDLVTVFNRTNSLNGRMGK